MRLLQSHVAFQFCCGYVISTLNRFIRRNFGTRRQARLHCALRLAWIPTHRFGDGGRLARGYHEQDIASESENEQHDDEKASIVSCATSPRAWLCL